MSVGSNIRRFRKEKGWKIIELANRVDSDVGNISRLERGLQGYSDELLRSIAKALGVPVSKLFEEEGNVAFLDVHRNDMPLISWVQAGAWCESPDNFAPGDAEEWLPRPSEAGPRSFALKVHGDSMVSPYPTEFSYLPGTIIYIDPDKPVENGSKVVARTETGEYTFKKYTEDAGKRYLAPLNPKYEMILITEGMDICGVLIGSYRKE